MSASAITDALRIAGRSQVQHAVTAAGTAQTSQLTGGLYDVWSMTDDFYIRVSVAPAGYIPTPADNTTAAALDTTAANGYLIRSGNVVSVFVPYGSRIGFYALTAQTISVFKVGE